MSRTAIVVEGMVWLGYNNTLQSNSREEVRDVLMKLSCSLEDSEIPTRIEIHLLSIAINNDNLRSIQDPPNSK
jgi:hypothetical protein